MFGIFDGREEEIANKRVFFGKLPINISEEFDWTRYMDLMDNHPEDMYDRNTRKFRIGLNNFHSRPSAPPFAKKIVDEMKEVFSLHSNNITNIAFSGFGLNSDSYPWHKDGMDVFLVQVLNAIELRVEGVNEEKDFWFTPGEYVWIPRGTHHRITPHKSRVTFSFGVEGGPDPADYF